MVSCGFVKPISDYTVRVCEAGISPAESSFEVTREWIVGFG